MTTSITGKFKLTIAVEGKYGTETEIATVTDVGFIVSILEDLLNLQTLEGARKEEFAAVSSVSGNPYANAPEEA